jgi:inosine-uridine nucleoside N-ribohydrolase
MSHLLWALPGLLLAAGSAPVPVILDTDIGDDIDDTWALAMLLGMEQLDLKLVVTAVNDTEKRTQLVAKLLDRVGRTNIPIGTGVKQNEDATSQEPWIAGYSFKTYPGVVHEDGVQAMIDTIMASPGPITLLTIGPLTNIGAALEREPRIAEKARVVAMAGSVRIGWNNAPEPTVEYNLARDLAATRAMFAAPWEITLVPLDICGAIRLKGDRYQAVEESEEERARVVIENCRIWARAANVPDGSSSILYDTVAVYLASDESLCEIETLRLRIADDGMLHEDPEGRPTRCALRWKDLDAFEDLLVAALTHPRQTPAARYMHELRRQREAESGE